MDQKDPTLADDLLWGAKPLALYVLGRADPAAVRKIFFLHEKKRIATFKVGDEVVGRKSEIAAGLSASSK